MEHAKLIESIHKVTQGSSGAKKIHKYGEFTKHTSKGYNFSGKGTHS